MGFSPKVVRSVKRTLCRMGTVGRNIMIYLDSFRVRTYPLEMPVFPLRFFLAVTIASASAGVAMATTADDICQPSADPCLVSGTTIVASGSTLDFGSRALVFPGGSGKKLELEAGTGLRSMTILAGSVAIEPGSAIVGKGGFVDIRTTGSVMVRRSGSTRARIDVSDQIFPGSISIVTTGPNGDVIIEGTVTAHGTGTDADGGGVDISASTGTSGGDIVLQGEIRAGGGGASIGGDVSLFASGSISSSGTIDVAAGDGGAIDIFAGTGVNITEAGTAKLVLQGTNAGGDGGDLDIQSLDGDVVVAQQIQASGAPEIDFAGSGGSITVLADQGSVRLAGAVTTSGAVPDGDGGDVSITAALDIVQTGSIVANGRPSIGGGGYLDFTADRAVTLGSIDVSGNCTECIGGDVDVTGSCDVILPSGATILNEGVAGDVRLSTGGTMRVAGVITTTGRVDLLHYDAGTLPDLSGSVITPAPLVMVSTSIPPCGCVVGTCGNAVVDCGEVCDDGNVVDDATCTADCSRAPACGDGTTDAFLGETCDDGNQVDCDGCSRTCRMEACGNSVTECEEQCDEGGATTTCEADCRLAPPPGCGDGVLDPLTEECDDGNLDDCDVVVPGTPPCSRLCTLQACGNGITECAEECDDFNNDPCDDCSPACRVETCGNGFVECGEECDDGEANGQPGSACVADACVVGEICQIGGSPACIPCASDGDCNVCAGMTCNPEGVCESTGADCDDENPCTADGCSAITGCTHELLNGLDVPACDDGNACTIPECDLEVGCVQQRLGDFEGVTCHLTNLDALVADDSVDDKARRVLGRFRAKVAKFVSKAAEGEQIDKLGRVKRGLKRARGRLRGMRKRVVRFTGKHITEIEVGGGLASEIDAAILDVEDLLRAFGFPA